jgi:hypothetical protein
MGRATRIQRIENLGDTWPVSGLTLLDFILTFPVAGTGGFWETGTNGGSFEGRHLCCCAPPYSTRTAEGTKDRPVRESKADGITL